MEAPAQGSLFQHALREYIDSRPPKSKTPGFIKDLNATRRPWKKEDVDKAIKELERENGNHTSTKVVRKVLKPVVRILQDYTAIIDTFAQADPMPTSLIWGCLKVVVITSSRFIELYEKIETQLEAMGKHFSLLIEYEELFGQSVNMRHLLKSSYIELIRFWHRVEKESKRNVVNRMGRSLVSFSHAKLDNIVQKVGTIAADVERLIVVVKDRIDRGEREKAEEERIKAGIARDNILQLVEERKAQRLDRARKWLHGEATPTNQSNDGLHEEYNRHRSAGTCSWILSHEAFLSWASTDQQDRFLWLRAPLGMGKSTICAFAIEQLKAQRASTHCIYQYYSFREEYSSLQVYRNLALQLIDCLWKQDQDLPEDIYKHTQQSYICSKKEQAVALIQLLAKNLTEINVFLDGLDEEYDSHDRRPCLDEIIDFLIELVSEKINMRLWCSSQDRAPLRSKLANFTLIEMDDDCNSQDIHLHISKRISQLDADEIDKEHKEEILETFVDGAKGQFLWASLMLNSIANAGTLAEVRRQIDDGLPEAYEDYYMRKLSKLNPSQKATAKIILYCVMNAKRPLRLSELSDATAVLAIQDGESMNRTQRLFKRQILNYCEPLVRISDSEKLPNVEPVCVLSHIAVRSFLLKRPEALASSLDSMSEPDTFNVLADICLKYLWQPSYRSLLRCNGDSLVGSGGEEIKQWPLLTYAAKYWDKHLDLIEGHRGLGGCEDPESFCHRTVRFMRSPQFLTCLQVQSLFIQGQFQFWLNADDVKSGPQIKRALPYWFTNECYPELGQDYIFFVGEWGFFLDNHARFDSDTPGEIDRCFWGALGPGHFLRDNSSRYNSFMLSADSRYSRRHDQGYYEGFDSAGDRAFVLRLAPQALEQSKLSFECTPWNLSSGSPQQSTRHVLEVDRKLWSAYNNLLSNTIVGRPAPTFITDNLRCIRIGGALFLQQKNGQYTSYQLDSNEMYVEEVATQGSCVAISWRRGISYNDSQIDSEDQIDQLLKDNEPLARKLRSWTYLSGETLATNESDFVSTQHERKLIDGSDEEDIELQDMDLEITQMEINEADESLSLDNEIESAANSAVTAWTEASTRASSELDVPDDWNDWPHCAADLEDVESSEDERSEEAGLALELLQDGELDNEDIEETDEGFDLRYREGEGDDTDENESSEKGDYESEFEDSVMSLSADSDQSLESRFSASYEGSSDDGSDSDDDHGNRIKDLLDGSDGAALNSDRRKLRNICVIVYDTSSTNKERLFRFTHEAVTELFASPPTFHPTKSLLVWPLGDNEILFADYITNTYFKQLLSCSSTGSCHVFVKSKFSSNGAHLHFAALEARPAEQVDGNSPSGIQLTLQVTTHQLSKRKTTQSPPRLIFVISVPLGRIQSLEVSDLPYELTWQEKEVYVTKRDEVLNVVRIPLYSERGSTEHPKAQYVQKRVYLPQTALNRRVQFFPAQMGRRGGRAMVLIGAHCTSLAQNRLVPPVAVSPPIGLFLDEQEDLGGWRDKPDVQIDPDFGKGLRQRAGRLRGMYEKFDMSEDCDLVPYLA